MKKNEYDIVVISDLHFGYDYRTKPRLTAFQRLVDEVSKIVKKAIVFLGDIFHSRFLRGEDVHIVIDGFERMKSSAEGYIILGNHDLESKERYVVRFLSKQFHLFTDVQLIDIAGYKCLVIPYKLGQPPPPLPQFSQVDLVLGHQYIQEFVNFPIQTQEGYSMDVFKDKAEAVIMGHLHTDHTEQAGITKFYTGCTIPVSFTDNLVESRYYVIKDGMVEVIHNHSVKFIDLRRLDKSVNIEDIVCDGCTSIIRAYEDDPRLSKPAIKSLKNLIIQTFAPVKVETPKSKFEQVKLTTAELPIEDALQVYVNTTYSALPETERVSIIEKGKEYLNTARR